MRIDTIELAWFRGAGSLVSLDAALKSIVVYGENGSGKSSFVDAIEFLMNGGKIGHLAHEYSGRHQEKGIVNTHVPGSENVKVTTSLADGSRVMAERGHNGKYAFSGVELLNGWDYRRTVLRQDELANFIRGTKGEKYSALLPLLGLHQLEVAAQNARQLARETERQFEISQLRFLLREVELKRKTVFGDDDDTKIFEKIETLHKRHAPANLTTLDALPCCNEIETAIQKRIAQFNTEQRRFFGIQSAATISLKTDIESVQTANAKLAEAIEPMVEEKLAVLDSASSFANKLGEQKEIKCPACGLLILVKDFQKHVSDEKKRLHEIHQIHISRKAAVAVLSDSVKSLKFAFGKTDLKSWREALTNDNQAENLKFLDSINAEEIRTTCSNDLLTNLQKKLLPLIEAATMACKNAPPEVQQLTDDKNIAEVAKAVIESKSQKDVLERATLLVAFLTRLEQEIREEIRLRCHDVISTISADIQRMWCILHPGEGIQTIQLYIPSEVEKAIDIELQFYGVKQNSPRLTLSEGYRNSLGLCIFLAMAKRETNKDNPLLLDDVVISLDRNHRGMIAELLQKEFADR